MLGPFLSMMADKALTGYFSRVVSINEMHTQLFAVKWHSQ